MHPAFLARGTVTDAVPIWFVTEANWPQLRQSMVASGIAYADAAGFEPKPRRHVVLPAASGAIAAVLLGIGAAGGEPYERFLPGLLPTVLPPGTYRFANAPHDTRLAALAFALGSYRFTRYRSATERAPQLELPEGIDGDDLSRIAEAVAFARDLINTPSNDMGPAELEDAARTLAARFGASVRSIEGDALLSENYPLVHAVGRASTRAPRLIDLTWGDPRHPKVTLVGKGVCFDTGGLDIKTEAGMRAMKKDMGGAATVLALARMVMDRGLKLRLRVLVPAVENAISGSAFRPLDVYRARNGMTVEIGNTDAEGRLILADALTAADEEEPDLLVDLGTLTGAARVALGPDLPPFYTDDESLADELARCAEAESDPLWRLPLWRPYRAMLDSKVADTDTVGSGGFAGSIICALFLQRFVAKAKAWLHLDIYAWTPSAKPGRPEGGECQAARALYALLAARYG